MIDLHLPQELAERIDCMRTPEDQMAKLAASGDKDAALWNGKGAVSRIVRPGEFALFFPPYCAHAPALAVTKPARGKKVVIKIRAASGSAARIW